MLGTVLNVGDGEMKNMSFIYVLYIGNVMYLCWVHCLAHWRYLNVS